MSGMRQAITAEGKRVVSCRKCKQDTYRLSRVCSSCQAKERKRYVRDATASRGDSVYDALAMLPEGRAKVALLWWSMNDELAVECASVFIDTKGSRTRLAKYRLKLHEWLELVALQKSQCAICQSATHPLALNIDHDHGTGVVRGLLCTPCNTGLGSLGVDNGAAGVERALAVLAYAQRAAEISRSTSRKKIS